MLTTNLVTMSEQRELRAVYRHHTHLEWSMLILRDQADANAAEYSIVLCAEL